MRNEFTHFFGQSVLLIRFYFSLVHDKKTINDALNVMV